MARARSRPPSTWAAAREPERQPADVAVGIRVGDEREGGASVPLDLEHRFEAEPALGERLHGRPGEDEIARAGGQSRRVRGRPFSARARHRVLHRRRSRSGAHSRGRARSGAASRRQACAPPSTGSRGSPERTWKHARPAAGDEAERDASVAAVQGLVEATVTREDVDPLSAAEPGDELASRARHARCAGRRPLPGCARPVRRAAP